mmetsp:Transcript_14482/g.31459  ORF Transcript_14482/g.31459 Transcript_14482/m.31459 type:complete len:296 (+) Transcript_14482:636-1523(+)
MTACVKVYRSVYCSVYHPLYRPVYRSVNRPVYCPVYRLVPQVLDDCLCEGVLGAGTAHIGGQHAGVTVRVDLEHRLLQPLPEFGHLDVPQHHGGGQQGGGGVGQALACQLLGHMAGTLLEDSDTITHIATGAHAEATTQACHHIGDQVAVQVGGHHDIKLLRLGDQLHARVVHNHLLVLDLGEVLSHLPGGLEEHAVTLLHDVGLVHRGNLLAVVEQCKLKCILGSTQGLVVCDDLEALHHALHRLVLQAAVLALRVLAHHHNVKVLVAQAGQARDGEAVHQVDPEVQVLPQLDI